MEARTRTRGARDTTATRGARDTTATRDGDTENMLPEPEVRFSPTVHFSHRRAFGLGPPSLLAGGAAAMTVAALVLFAAGSWVAGLVFALLAAVSASLFLVGARREPDARSARLARGAADRADVVVRAIAITSRAWLRGGLELARIWRWRRRSRAQLNRRLTPLGEAVFRDDPDRAAQLKAEAQQFDQAIQEADRRKAEVVAALRSQVERERATTQRTEQLPVVQRSDAD